MFSAIFIVEASVFDLLLQFAKLMALTLYVFFCFPFQFFSLKIALSS